MSIIYTHKVLCIPYLFFTLSIFIFYCHIIPPLEGVSRYREPQLQVGANYTHFLSWDQTYANPDF